MRIFELGRPAEQWYLLASWSWSRALRLLELQQKIIELRGGVNLGSPKALAMRNQIRVFQNKRLRATYADLVGDKATRSAAVFFLDSLYGTENLSRRDEQAQRVLPKANKYLPAKAVAVLELVLEMDLLAEEMDARLGVHLLALGAEPSGALDDATYLQAFRAMGEEATRLRQISLVPEVGAALGGLLRLPLLSSILKMTRGAAQKANLEDFHEFLQMGVSSFKQLKNPNAFFGIIVQREQHLLNQIYREGLLNFPSAQSMPR